MWFCDVTTSARVGGTSCPFQSAVALALELRCLSGPLHATIQCCRNGIDVRLGQLAVLQGALLAAGALAHNGIPLAVIGCEHGRPVYVRWFILGQLQ